MAQRELCGGYGHLKLTRHLIVLIGHLMALMAIRAAADEHTKRKRTIQAMQQANSPSNLLLRQPPQLGVLRSDSVAQMFKSSYSCDHILYAHMLI